MATITMKEALQPTLEKLYAKYGKPNPNAYYMKPNYSEFMSYNYGHCIPNCEICRGMGHVRYDVDEHDQMFGKLFPCPNRGRPRVSIERNGIDERDAKELVWDGIYNLNGINLAVDAIIRASSQGSGWVVIWGDYGVGKTRALKTAVAVELRAKRDAVYVNMSQILNNLMEGFNSDAKTQTETERLKYWASVPFLAIDEVDKIRDTAYSSTRRFDLLDARYESAVNGRSVTVFALNSHPQELPDSIYDRMRDGRFEIIHVSGDSVRPSMTQDELF